MRVLLVCICLLVLANAAAPATAKAPANKANKVAANKPAAAPAAKVEAVQVVQLPVVKVAPKVSRSAPAKASPTKPGPPPNKKAKEQPKAANKANNKAAPKPSSAKPAQAKPKSQAVPRFTSLTVRQRMEVSGWLDAFFQRFVELANKLTAAVKARVSALIQGLEAQLQQFVDMSTVMWNYFKDQGVSQGLKNLWINTRCDICQSAVVRIYLRGCDYAKMGICNIVSQVACGTLAADCKKFICPLLNKMFLDDQCTFLMSRLNSAIAANPLDNFASLAVCKRVNLCKEFDEPFDGKLMAAVVEQAKQISAATAGKSDADAQKAIEQVTSKPSPVVIPSQRFSQPGTYSLPGLGCVIHIWINNQVKSERYGKPYYILDKQSGPTAGIPDLLWLTKIDGKHIDVLGPQGVLEALNTPLPGTKIRLDFVENGFFGLKDRAFIVTAAAWPVTLVEVRK